MGYYADGRGSRFHTGFGYYGLGTDMTVDWTSGIEAVRDLQRELQRLGFLDPGAGSAGADGKWGPLTALALRGAARHVGWVGNAYWPLDAGTDAWARTASRTTPKGTVRIEDALVDRLRAAAPASRALIEETMGENAPGAPVNSSALVEPDTSPSSPVAPDGGWPDWATAVAVAGGAAVLIGAIAWGATRKKKAKVQKNRRRRRVSRRR